MVLGCSTATVGSGNAPFMAARATTVRVDNLVGSIGAGNVLNDRCVVTAAHVADREIMGVTTPSGKVSYMAKVIRDEDADIAVMCGTEKIDAPAISFGAVPATYDPVFAIGYPLGRRLFLTEGRWQDDDMISAPCAPGNSGGGVFNAAGQYVGFLDAMALLHHYGETLPVYHLCDVVSVKDIQAFLTAHMKEIT